MPYLERISKKAEKRRKNIFQADRPCLSKVGQGELFIPLHFYFWMAFELALYVWQLICWAICFKLCMLRGHITSRDAVPQNTRNLHWICSLVICKHGCAIIHLNKLFILEKLKHLYSWRKLRAVVSGQYPSYSAQAVQSKRKSPEVLTRECLF